MNKVHNILHQCLYEFHRQLSVELHYELHDFYKANHLMFYLANPIYEKLPVLLQNVKLRKI
jgi:hypothetical protein